MKETLRSNCYRIDGLVPVVGKGCFIHPSAEIIGDVIIGDQVYIGPGARLRGDSGRIVVHDLSNIQDNCVFHGWPGIDTVVEKNGHIGHGAIVHGAHIMEGVLVGMNAVILEGVVVGEYAVVGAQALVSKFTQIPKKTLALGVPAKVKRTLSEDEVEKKIKMTNYYHQLTTRSIKSLEATTPLSKVEKDRKRIQDIYPELSTLLDEPK